MLQFHAMPRQSEILFATKIFSKGGCYADYDGRVMVQTNNGDEIVVPLTSRERADWCVIAKISNDANGPLVTNVNRARIPNYFISFLWCEWGRMVVARR